MTTLTLIRILLADDHAIIRAGIRQLLEHSGDIHIAAGSILFLSPCVLPLVPAYVGYLSGHSMIH